ncbi:threonine--tRNA ligase [Deltaproteobacteria bacterium]|nr:threonine--tRNA ligase [Deltaproteobacteria bacterium]
MEDHEKGREAFANEESYRLHALRHSTAHIMAEAIATVFPGAKFAFGPPVEDGFYYDVDVSRTITEADFPAIEEAMKAVVKRNSQFVRRNVDHAEAATLFEGQPYKLEHIGNLEGPLGTFDQGGFVDLCNGPHALRTGQCKHFKLMKVSGAYWKGDASRPMLQRVYGTVWPTREALDQYLFRLEEAKKRDHRRVGQQMGLFYTHEWAPGAIFWLPKGEVLYHTLSEAMRTLLLGEGYVAVRTPMLFEKDLWELSGHWAHYRENMFTILKQEEGETEGRAYSLKPMNCPSHMLLFRSTKRSYRELPLRIHDQGVLHRDEVKGALGGLTRVRQFSQDDAHLFCMEEQVEQEVTDLIALVNRVYGAMGLGYKAKLSTRPVEKLGGEELWDRAERALENALKANNLEWTVNAGDGAFYGPKIDFDVIDALGRAWQCATIQLDYQVPIRFELSYVGADNAPHVPVVIHRAIFGSFERFIGILIEHYAGAFPAWMAPEQVRVMTVSEKSVAWGAEVVAALKSAGIRVFFDDRDDKIGAKIREAHAHKPAWQVVVGERDAENRTVSVKSRDADLGALTTEEFVAVVAAESKVPFAVR